MAGCPSPSRPPIRCASGPGSPSCCSWPR
jgi:hypothetical protein